jgi:hypothetical protein
VVNFGRRFHPEPGQNCTPVHNQQTEAFLEGERVGVGCLALLLKGLRHAVQFHGSQCFQGIFRQHEGSVWVDRFQW